MISMELLADYIGLAYKMPVLVIFISRLIEPVS